MSVGYAVSAVNSAGRRTSMTIDVLGEPPTMKIVVVVGGLSGSRLVSSLSTDGHDVVAALRSTGVDTISATGLNEALTGADAVVDVTDPPSFDAEPALEFFSTSTRNLSDAELRTGVAHHVIHSIVGAECMAGSGYMRAKTAQENLARDAPVSGPCCAPPSSSSSCPRSPTVSTDNANAAGADGTRRA